MKKGKDFVAITIGTHIRTHRKAQGLTIAKLAEYSYLSSNYLGDVESGRKTATLKSIYKIAVGLEIDPTILIAKIHPDIFPKIEKEVKDNRPE